jgi:hypothetical protein
LGSQDAQMLIGHALAMALEGSTLDALAQQSGGSLGATGGPGTGGSGPGGQGRSRSEAGPGGDGRSVGMMDQGLSARQLLDHSRWAWEASDRLLRQAADQGGSTEQRFHRATLLYVMTLRAAGSPATYAAGGPRREAGSGVGAGAALAGRGAGAMGGSDMTTVALINHAVKEALDSVKLKRMVHRMGSSESPAARALLAHAQEMDRESQQALRGLLRSGAGRAGKADLDGGAGSIQVLAQQAQELVQVIREIGGDAGGAPGGDRGGVGGGAGDRGAESRRR